MSKLYMAIQDANKEVYEDITGDDYIEIVFPREYKEGDSIVFKTDAVNNYYVIQLDDALGANFVYITKNEFRFPVPFGDRKTGYSPKAFDKNLHLLYARVATPEEISAYKNLAYNIYDEHGDTGCYPHATANVETRNEPSFFARCVIDGIRTNTSHGIWPYCSWGIDRRPDAEIMLDFGRDIKTDKIVLVIRADFPHDSWWKQATLEFSDGSSLNVSLKKTATAQEFTFPTKTVSWIKLNNLIKSDDPSPFPALSQWEVYGTDELK